jgi:hypothetical protein
MLDPPRRARVLVLKLIQCMERGAVGIRMKPAAAIVRRYGEQFRAPRRQRRPRPAKPPPLL